jgi:integrase
MKDNVVEVFSADVPEKAVYTAIFKFEGKNYRLFKREPSKDANWYIHFVRRGKRFLRSLDTNVKENAIGNAKAIIAAVKAEHWETLESLTLRSKCATIGDVIEVYERHPDERQPATMKGNVLAIRRVLRIALGREDVDGLKTTVLTGELVRKYKVAVETLHKAKTDALDEQQWKRSANSNLQQARSLFAKHVLVHYRDEKLKIPDVTEFMEEVRFRNTGKVDYCPPSDDLIAETFKRLDALKETDREAYVAICLACGTGMRKKAIGQARWSWFQQRNGQAYMRSDVLGKNKRVIDLPVIDEWWRRLQAVRAEQLGRSENSKEIDPFVLSGHMSERTEEVFRRVSAWMRGLGWKTEKTIHEFRAYVGSKVAMEFGIEAASMFLTHSDITTTLRFYGRYMKLNGVKLGTMKIA